MYTSGSHTVHKGDRSSSPVASMMTSSGEISPRRRTSVSGPGSSNNNNSFRKASFTVGNSHDVFPSQFSTLSALPPPQAVSTSFAPIGQRMTHSGEDDDPMTSSQGQVRARSQDAKATSVKSLSKRTSIFGKKKSTEVPTIDDFASSSSSSSSFLTTHGTMPSPHRAPMLPPLPAEAEQGRMSLRPPPAFLQALDSSMMRRSSYSQLVDKGIVREWKEDSSTLDSDMIAALPPPSAPSLAPPPQASRMPSAGMLPVPDLYGSGSTPVPVASARSTVMVQPSVKDGGWHVERGSADFVEGAYNALEDDHNCSPYFKIYFNGKEHTNYWAEHHRVGPVLVSVAATSGTVRTSSRRLLPDMATHKSRHIIVHRCLIQSRQGSKQIFVRSAADKTSLFKGLALACGPMGYLPEIQEMRFQKVLPDITEDLLRMERAHFSSDYKFGVLYYRKDQTENEMFSNSTSPEMENFLNFLGDRITLKGWTGFTGGLDVKSTHSVFTQFRDLNVMFHVCTLLPYNPKDLQQLERKRHIGNDIVVIVYVEPGATFDPCMMKTQFNHIYAIVSVDPKDNRVRLEFAVKQGVRPFGPQLLPNQRFHLDASFREFFFSKLINSERASLKATVFAAKLEHTRMKLIECTIEKVQKTK